MILEKKVISVGITQGDIIGNTDMAIQAAIDYLANIGGGTVNIGEGNYTLNTAIHLRSNVNLIGIPGKTILKKAAVIVSRLSCDADLHQHEITLHEPEKFHPGQTVTIREPRRNNKFFDTVAIITGKKGNTCYIDHEIYCTNLVKNDAVVETSFPLVSGYNCDNVIIENLVLNGNKSENNFVDGCRNAGIYLFEATNINIRNCIIHDYNGDGISYQCCHNINIIDCHCINNEAKGIHPGSGTEVGLISNCKIVGNGNDGIFLCWRVKYFTVENCISSNNKMSGLSIGHKDTHNIIRNNLFIKNAYYGIFFRNEPANMSADFNLVEGNTIKDNGWPEFSSNFGYAAIRIRGYTNNVKFINNKIIFENVIKNNTIGICCENNTYDNIFEGNEFIGCYKDFHHSCTI